MSENRHLSKKDEAPKVQQEVPRCLIGMEACVGAPPFRTAVHPDRDWI